MDTIKQSAGQLEFSHALSPIARLVFLVFGLLPLLAPYELLVKPTWHGFSIIMLFFAALSLGALTVSGFMIAAALFGRSQQFIFDAPRRLIRYRYQTVLPRFREERYPFSQIETLGIQVSEWDSRADTFDLHLKIRGKREMQFGDFTTRQDAEYYLSELQKMIAG